MIVKERVKEEWNEIKEDIDRYESFYRSSHRKERSRLYLLIIIVGGVR